MRTTSGCAEEHAQPSLREGHENLALARLYPNANRLCDSFTEVALEDMDRESVVERSRQVQSLAKLVLGLRDTS